MDQIPLEPAGTALFLDFPTHSFVERENGVGLVPNKGPLYFALFFYALVPVAWYLTKGLNIEPGIKLVAWLFPAFTATGPFILWIIMTKFCASFFFNIYRNELILKGFRFKGERSIPFDRILGIQTCFGGSMRTSTGAYYEKYELNAVLTQDGKTTRIHLVGHADRKTIERQAMKITERVPVQLFDHIDESIRRWSDENN
jgi:hypothetical protein